MGYDETVVLLRVPIMIRDTIGLLLWAAIAYQAYFWWGMP